jgi:hypothetical protein
VNAEAFALVRNLRPVHVVEARVATQFGQPIGQPPQQPLRRPAVADVDGEIEHPGRDGLIAVIARRRRAQVQTRHP